MDILADELLREFRCNAELHGKVVDHLIAKKVPLSQANLFFQPETWEILSDKIAAHEYHFSPLIEGYVDKRNGNPMSYAQAFARNFEDVRKIYMMTPMDRAVAHMIYLIYYRKFIGMSHERCVSYKNGIGTSKVARNLSMEMQQKSFYEGYKMDIHHYFDDVNIETIEKQLIDMKSQSHLDSLLWELYHDDRVLVNDELVHKHRGLIQGCAFACLLANLILKDVDEMICNMNVIYYRYSDDIIVLGRDRDTEVAMKTIKEYLKPKGLQLHPKKVQRVDARNNWFEFLGFKFKRDMISISEKTLHNLRHEIKTRTVSKTRQAHRPATKAELRKMIDDLQWYFFTAFAKSQENFGMGVYLFGTVNVLHDLRAIEDYCKDCLRAAYTNKSNIYGLGSVNRRYYAVDCSNLGQNVRANRDKTQSEEWDLLKECGWVSLIKMYNDYHTNMDLFENSVFRMMNGI